MVKLFKTPSHFHLLKLYSLLGSFHIRRFSSKKSNLSSIKSALSSLHHSNDTLVLRVCEILCDNRWKWSSELIRLSPKFTPYLVERVIHTHMDTGSLLQFFYWVSKTSTYEHDFNCYFSMLDRLVFDCRYEDAHHLIILTVKACKNAQELKRVMDYLVDIRRRGLKINLYSFNTLLIALGRFDMVGVAYNVYNEMICSGVSPSLLTFNTLINISCKKAMVREAEIFLSKICRYGMWPDVFTYTSLILGHCRNHNLGKAFGLFDMMLKEGCEPNSVTYSILINRLCDDGRIDEGLRLLREMVEKGVEPTVYTYTLPILRLCECGRVEEASRVVGAMLKRGCRPNVHTYTALISGLSHAGNLEVATGLYNKMMKDDVFPNTTSCNALIHVLCDGGRVEQALKIFEWMEAHGCLRNSRTYNEIMSALCLRGSVEEAMVLFGDMNRNGPSPTVATYNILINGFIMQKNLDHALRLYDLMRESGYEPDEYTYAEIISGFCKEGNLELASSIFHDLTERGLLPTEFIFTILIDGHCKRGNVDGALELLGKMKEYSCSPVIETFNAIISGLAKENRFVDAEKLCSRMSEYGFLPNVVTYTSLIDGLCRHGGTNLALKVLNEMEKNNCQPNLHTYSVLIHGFCKEGKVDCAEGLFEQMQREGISPDVVVFTSLIDGFVMVGRLDHAFRLLQKMLESSCQANYRTFSVLLKGLHKECHFLVNKVAVQNDVSYSFPSDAKDIGSEVVSHLFARLSEIDVEPTVSTYDTLITGLCREGKYYEAEQLVKNMQEKQLPLNNGICNSLLIIHCKRLRVEAALDILKSTSSSDLKPPLSTYALLICTLCKLNQVDEAVLLFKDVLDKNWNSDEVVWSVLLDGLLKEGQLEPCVKLLQIIQSSKHTVSLFTSKLLAEEMSKVDGSLKTDVLVDKRIDTTDPLGEVEFRSVLYVPSMAPQGKDDVMNFKTKNIRLYVKQIFISDDFDGELFPRYLSFIRGVVDSSNLPLNFSREILQESRIVRIMRKRLVKKSFDMILGISMSENRDDYEKFWENFGKHLKLGCIEDRDNHKRIAPLLRFFSSQSENEMISLGEYVENMKAEQKDIYYIASDSVTSAKNTPFLEKLLEKDLELIPLMRFAVQNLKSYKEKNFVDISKEGLDLGVENEQKETEVKQEFGRTCDWIKKRLGDKVASVQVSNGLSSSPCVLVFGKFGWSANMERLMKAQHAGDSSGLDFMKSRRVLEINPDHSIIKSLHAACKSGSEDEEALRAVDLSYDATLVSSGFTPENPAQLGGKIYEMMGMALSNRWGSSLDAQQPVSPPQNPETMEAEIVEPVQADGQK